MDTIERVNRLISGMDDQLPAEGLDGVKTVYKKLTSGLHEIQSAAATEAEYARLNSVTALCMTSRRAIDDAIECLDVLIALRSAPEVHANGRVMFMPLRFMSTLLLQRSAINGHGHPLHQPPPPQPRRQILAEASPSLFRRVALWDRRLQVFSLENRRLGRKRSQSSYHYKRAEK